MSIESSAHKSQLAVLRHLLFTPTAGFAELQKSTGLSSDHFNFHVKKLRDEGYIDKTDDGYRLTKMGKEYANRLDTDDNVIEKQPKVSIVITLERENDDGEREFLYQQRLKNPYFGFWGRLGGKMRWGESVIEAANRELQEETGLEAKFTYKLLYHKRDFDQQNGELLEDKIFLCVHATEFTGELVERFEGGYNRWMTQSEFQAQEKQFKSVDEFTQLMDQGVGFCEREFYYDQSEY